MSEKFEIEFIESLSRVSRDQWQAVIDTDFPFIQYDFLKSLEQSGSVAEGSGWQPNHLVVKSANALVALLPLYIKSHSYGEYVFDFQWAEAYHRSGREYYPKLVSAIPFSPVTGGRLYAAKGSSLEVLYPLIIEAVIQFAQSNHCSSWHVLFPNKIESERFTAHGLLCRVGLQYHWLNKPYSSFDAFLQDCKQKKRKNILRERQSLKNQAIAIQTFEGAELNAEMWQSFYLFYQLTYAKRSGHGGYLSDSFFQLIGQTMAANIVLIGGFLDGEMIAASLFFKDHSTLYGRYWGCTREIEFLHFELCYYQGIDYCIRHQLSRFDAGAQGEHKISRGFRPLETYSNHWIAEPAFRDAIGEYLGHESKNIKHIIEQVAVRLPFKQ
jgi:uncharacterized protein